MKSIQLLFCIVTLKVLSILLLQKPISQVSRLAVNWVSNPHGKDKVIFRLPGELKDELFWMKSPPSIAGLIQWGDAVNMPLPVQGVQIIGHIKQTNMDQWKNTWKQVSPFLLTHSHFPFMIIDNTAMY